MSTRNLTHPRFQPELNTKLTQIAEAIQYLSDAGILNVSGLTLPSGPANRVLASPDALTGTVTLRALVATDIPSLAASKITSGQLAAARGGTGQDSSASTGVPRVSGGTWTFAAGISHLAASTSADLRGVLSDETGTGAAVFADTPTLVTPILGTPTSGTLTNCVGLPLSSGVTGAFSTPTFSAGNFAGSGSMTWTVGSGDVGTYAYIEIGKLMHVAFSLTNTTVGGTPSFGLKITIPNGRTAAKTIHSGSVIYSDAGGALTTGYCQTIAADTAIYIVKLSGANWSAATDTTNVFGQTFLEFS